MADAQDLKLQKATFLVASPGFLSLAQNFVLPCIYWRKASYTIVIIDREIHPMKVAQIVAQAVFANH